MGGIGRLFARRRRDPSDADALLRGALLSVLDRDLAEAERLLSRAVRADDRAVEPYLALGRLYRMRGEVGRAIQVHQNQLLRQDLNPEQITLALSELAADFREGGFVGRAIATYEEVLTRSPRHAEALQALVALRAGEKDFDAAIEMSRRLKKLEGERPNLAEAALRVEMAEQAAAEGRSDDARKALKRALRRDRKSVRAWLALGLLEAERGRDRAALAAWSKVPEVERRQGPLVYPRLAAAYAALGRPRDFESHLRGLIKAEPGDPHARLALARALAARGDMKGAEQVLRELVELRPDDLEPRSALLRLRAASIEDPALAGDLEGLLETLERQDILRDWEKLA